MAPFFKEEYARTVLPFAERHGRGQADNAAPDDPIVVIADGASMAVIHVDRH